MKQLSAIIVEDENKARETLKNLLQTYCPEVALKGMASNVAEGVALIDESMPDVVFLDIEMRSGTGFDLLERVSFRDFEVIFTTAYEHYALKAIKASAIDYLLKPIDWNELQAAVAKVQAKRSGDQRNKKIEALLLNMNQQGGGLQTITLSTQEGLEFVKVRDILRCEANGAYTNFHIAGGRHILVSKNIKEYERMLEDLGFFRVHQSHIINLGHIRKFIRGKGQSVLLSDGSKVEVSYRRKDDFLEAVKNWQQMGE